MSSIRNRVQGVQNQNQNQNQNQRNQGTRPIFPGHQQQPNNQRYYGPILAHGAITAMFALQDCIADALSVPTGTMPMNKGEWLSLERLAKCGSQLAETRKKCGAGGWSRSQQQWADANNADATEGEANDVSQVAQDNNANYNANQTQRSGAGFAHAGAR